MNIQKMMKEAQKLQGKYGQAQEELARKVYEADAGGGMVKVTMSGSGELQSVRIDRRVVDPEDVEALEDLVLAAVNNARSKVEEESKAVLGSLTQGLRLPGM